LFFYRVFFGVGGFAPPPYITPFCGGRPHFWPSNIFGLKFLSPGGGLKLAQKFFPLKERGILTHYRELQDNHTVAQAILAKRMGKGKLLQRLVLVNTE